jgi:hypothetical protein
MGGNFELIFDFLSLVEADGQADMHRGGPGLT